MRPGARNGRINGLEPVMRRNLTNNLREMLRTFTRPFDSYRPELHYMRGPGPKWHAKRGAAATTAITSAAAKGVAALGAMAKAHA